MVKVTEKINHDSMWIKAQLPSGAWFKFTVNRGGERLEAALSNDSATLKQQLQQLRAWLNFRSGENNLQRFQRIRAVAEASRNSAELISNLSNI